jgi:integrase
MARMSKMDYQMHLRMEQMKNIGESRHQAKQEYKEMLHIGEHANNRTVGIHSYKTYTAYKQTSMAFIKYMRNDHKEVKDITDIKREHVIEYLQTRQNEGKSSYTISKDMAALNKLLFLGVTKKDAGIKKRTYKVVTRSRLPRKHDSKYNPSNYKHQILFAKSTGCRRQSVLKVTPEDFVWKDGLPISVRLVEKGGKERYATILFQSRTEIKSIIESKNVGEPLFKKYTKKIDNHAFRAEYARNRYREILGNCYDKNDYRGFDKDVLGVLTKDLGHNRLDVVVYHYLK